MTKAQLPKREEFHWPTLRALDESGGSASIKELLERIADDLNLPDEILDIPHGEGPRSEFNYRAAWARTDLKILGAVDNVSKGIWIITEYGRTIQTKEKIRELVREQRKSENRNVAKQPRKANTEQGENTADDKDWKEELLSIIREIKPDAFERLCQRVLRESGFVKVEVTGRSGDGGIDGAGVLRVNLISFHVRFQCKKYAGSVGAPEIRDFRGAMVGRADKGLFITTGGFTKSAEREAVRDGAPAIDLIDGTDLCNLLKDLNLGVITEPVERVRPQPDFFQGF